MKGNHESLVSLAERVEAIERSKEDFLVPGPKLTMADPESLTIDGGAGYHMTPTAHGQLATKLTIPKKYYDFIGSIPGLREHNVNTLLGCDTRRHMVRTLEGTARAVLSDKFKPLDNMQVLEAFLPTLSEHRDLQVHSCSLTDDKLYLQLVYPRLQGEVAKGDVVQYGLTLTNSEVGKSSINVESWFLRLMCINGMVGKSLMHKYHVGRAIGNEEEDFSIYQHDTLLADVQAMKLRMRDVIANALTEVSFAKALQSFREAANDEIENPQRTVENVTQRFGFSEETKGSILKGLIHESTVQGSINRWGLANSITALAHDIENPDRAYDMEKIGNDIIELSPSQWKELSA